MWLANPNHVVSDQPPLVLNEQKRKQGNKKEKLTQSLHLTVKKARRSNYNIDLRELRKNKITAEATKRL